MDNDNLLYFATFSKAIPSFNSSRANSNLPFFTFFLAFHQAIFVYSFS